MTERAGKVIFETERLLLRRLKVEDAAFMCELLNSEGWLKYIGDRQVKTMEAAEKYLKEKVMLGYSMNGLGMLMVENKDPKVSMGICGLVTREGLEAPDIGFAFLPAYTGMGFAYESAIPVLQFAREELRLPKVQAITVKENKASIRLLQKLGLLFTKTTKVPNDDEELMLFEINFNDTPHNHKALD